MADTKRAARTDEHLGAYARGFAHFEYFAGRDAAEILKRLEVDPAAWDTVEAYGQAVLVQAAKVKDLATLAIYGTAFEQARRALAARNATLDDVLKMPFPAEPPPPAPPLLAELMAPKPRKADPPSPSPPAPVAPPSAARGADRPAPPPSAPAPPASPRDTPSSEATPHLTMEQYARFRAEIMASTPQVAAEVRAKYGLDDGSEKRETTLWSVRFTSDPALFENYKAAFRQFRTLQGAAAALGDDEVAAETRRHGAASSSALPSAPSEPSLPGAPSEPALPPPPPAPAGAKLSITTYASVCAWGAVHPEKFAEGWAKYGLAGPAIGAEHGLWRAHFAKYPKEHDVFLEEVKSFMSHWRR